MTQLQVGVGGKEAKCVLKGSAMPDQTSDSASDDIVVLSVPQRVPLADTAAFAESFREFASLLVRLSDRVVVAASRTYDYDAMFDKFAAQHQGEDALNYMVFHGPAALLEVAKSRAASARRNEL